MMVKSKLKKIALIGQPNVGKSSLFNRILKKRSAIISEISGTTRDIKKSNIYILDKESILIDTGGIDKTQDLIFSKVKENSKVRNLTSGIGIIVKKKNKFFGFADHRRDGTVR